MPLGLISDSDFESELQNSSVDIHSSNGLEGQIVTPKPLGRGKGNTEVPESLRKIIGETSELEGRQEALAIAKEFGISDSSVSAYADGSNSLANYGGTNQDLSNYIDKAKLKAGKKASLKLLKALNHITDDKLTDAKVSDLAMIAKAMSGIVKDMEPERKSNDGKEGGPTIVIYAPRAIPEAKFDVIEVRE